MRILILDDLQIRHDAYRKLYSNHELAHAYNYNDFVKYLNQGVWDYIHLDHDLGAGDNPDYYLDGFGKSREYTGQDAAKLVVQLDYQPKVIIHSINTVGANQIKQILQDYQIEVIMEPFNRVGGW